MRRSVNRKTNQCALEFFVVDALYKSTFTYLLTYFHAINSPKPIAISRVWQTAL